MEPGSIIHHFRITRVRELKELGARLWEMEHEGCGAQLVWLDRPDENKCFSIAFKTVPEDDTGVFHILEHSVLCGSDKYPVKEPFVELLKSSVQTFLNALTFPDKTVYPVSSRNDKDFLNLVDIYLDAVLHPAIYHKPEIFRQEGWRYEFGPDGAPLYQGVVFNEMKGSMANPMSILYQELGSVLLPDTCYRFNSGGDPEHIPDLSYEQFIAMHRKYYHPANARISLVGGVDLDAVLARIDSFLAPYARQAADFPIPLQAPVGAVRRERPYEIGPEEPENERAIVGGAVTVGRFDEQKKIFAAKVLADYLAGDNEAPLKRAILDAALGQEVLVMAEGGLQQSMFAWVVMNTAADKESAIRRTVRETVDRILAGGFDRERLSACVNRFAFDRRDREGHGWPRSLDEAISMLDSWLYGGDPAEPLLLDETLEALKAEIDGNYYTELLRGLFPADAAELLLRPSKTLGEERRAKEAARVAAAGAAWTEEEKALRHTEAERLAAWQQTPDSPEALATIPMLQLSDLAEKPEPLPFTVEIVGETPVLRHALSSDIVYARLHFNASDLTLEELPALSLLAQTLGKQGTEQHSAAALQTRVKQVFGRLAFAAQALPGRDGLKAKVLLSVNAAFLQENRAEALALLEEILCRTAFADPIAELIKQGALADQMALVGAGHRYAFRRAAAQVSAVGAAREAFSGYTRAQWLKAHSQDGEEELAALRSQLKALAKRIFTRERLVLSLSDNAGEAADWAAVAAPGEGAPAEADYPTLPKKSEGIAIPADVGFAAMASHARLHGRGYSGSIPALANVLNFEYLWSEVRVQGGAYGCGFAGVPEGELDFYSYRDPQPGRSLGVFKAAADFLRAHVGETDDLTRYILGAVTELDPLRDAEGKMAAAERLWFRGGSQAELDQSYAELLHTTGANLLNLAGMLEELAADDFVCVVGGEKQLEACGEQLEEILRG